MSKHNNIYNILGKLNALAPAAPKQENILKELNESAEPLNPMSLKDRLTQRYAEIKEGKDEGKPGKNFAKIAKSAGERYGSKEAGERVAGAVRAKLAKQGKLEEGTVDEELLLPHEKKFAALAEPKNKITYADKIAGAKKDGKKSKDVKEGRINEGAVPFNGEADYAKIAKWKETYMRVNPRLEPEEAEEKACNKLGFDYEEVLDWVNNNQFNEGEGDVVPDKSWVKHPEDPASKVPAYQRKANEPGRQAAQAGADQMNANVGAQVFRSGRPAPMEEEQYDENNAHSSLPGVRKVSPEEHSEYDAAAHTVRKWMRKRGWDPKSEFKPALKYVMDNLDSSHDDTLTDDVKAAACTCDKHHKGIVDEAFPTVADARARSAAEKGTGKFDKQQTSTGTRYTRKSDTFSDDDSEDKSTSDGPKKRGRPAKNKGPERVTAKAYKHKGGRVSEAINLETYVEDTMAEIEALFITEAAKRKAKETAKQEEKKSVEKVTESKNYLAENTLQAIVRKFGKEVREFAETGDFDQDLFEALYDYYFDDMPYGVKKARDGDPYEWIGDAFHEAIENGDVEINETKIAGTHKELDELARLAGLAPSVAESGCNMTAEGQSCPVHGLAECGSGMMYESEEKADKDYDEDGEIETGAEEHAGSVDKAIKKAQGEEEEEKLDECGVPVQMGGMGGEQSGMNINTSMDTKTGRKSVTVSAEGEAAEQLAAMLKMAGLSGGAKPEEKHVDVVIGRAGGDEEVAEEYANEPNEQVRSTSSIVKQGNDLNRIKRQDPATANRAANPMAEDIASLKARLDRITQQ